MDELVAALSRSPDLAAQTLLGATVRAGPVTVRLTEVEAYAGVGEDPASHAHRGPTTRNEVMFGPAGVAYVYFVFGMHWCLNVVCGPVGEASAVLLRAGAVTGGVELARRRRGERVPDRELARGPACLTIALGIDGGATRTSMVDGRARCCSPRRRSRSTRSWSAAVPGSVSPAATTPHGGSGSPASRPSARTVAMPRAGRGAAPA